MRCYIDKFSPGHNDSQTRWTDPSSYHKCSVEEDEHSWFWLQSSDLAQSLSHTGHDLVAVVLLDVPSLIHPSLGQHHMILLILQVPGASFCDCFMCLTNVFFLYWQLITNSRSRLPLPGAGNPSILARKLRPCGDPVLGVAGVPGVSPEHRFIARVVWVVTWQL